MKGEHKDPRVRNYQYQSRNLVDLIKSGDITFDDMSVHSVLRLMRNPYNGIVVTSPKIFSLEMGKSHDFCRKAFASLKERGWIQYNNVNGSQKPFPIIVIDSDFLLYLGSDVDVNVGMVGLNSDENVSREIELRNISGEPLEGNTPVLARPVQRSHEKTSNGCTGELNAIPNNPSGDIASGDSGEKGLDQISSRLDKDKIRLGCNVPVILDNRQQQNNEMQNPLPSSYSPNQEKGIDEQISIQEPPNRILWTDMPEYTVVNAGMDGKTLTAVIDGERYIVTDNRIQAHQGTAAGGESADVQVSKGVGKQEGTPAPPLVCPTVQSDDEVEAAHDSVDCECEITVTCPKCDSPLVYQRGRVDCIECDWSFGYRKFKRLFLGDEGKMARWQEGKMEGEEDRIPNPTALPPDRLASSPEYGDSISTGEAVNNRGMLSGLLNGMATPQMATEGLVDGMAGDVDPNRISSATTNLSGGLGDDGDGNADEEESKGIGEQESEEATQLPNASAHLLTRPLAQNGGNGQAGEESGALSTAFVKRSKEETLRLLKRLALSEKAESDE